MTTIEIRELELDELEYDLLCKTLQQVIDNAGDQPAPKVMALCNLLIKVRAQRASKHDRRKA